MCQKLLDTTVKTGLDAAKAIPKKRSPQTAEATDKLIGNKTCKKNVKQNLRLIWIEEMLNK